MKFFFFFIHLFLLLLLLLTIFFFIIYLAIGGRLTTDAKWTHAYERALDVVSKMSLPEKVNLTTGTGWSSDLCIGNTGSVPRFGIPSLCLQDGPLGVRFADLITAFPSALTAGSTFDKDLIALRGRAMAEEHKAKGVHAILGPVVGPVGRNALGGRLWETFGADPYLAGIGARLTTREIQNTGLIATVKHFIGSEQERFRQADEDYGLNLRAQEALSVNIDDRTLHELYLWPFADVVHEGVGSVMCTYNKVNNTHSCENSYLMNKLLKEELGFQGFVMSDWWAQRSGVPSIRAGMDMAMPGEISFDSHPDSFFGPTLLRDVLAGSVPDWRLNDMVTRILAAYFYVGLDQNKVGGPNFSSWTKNDNGYLNTISKNNWAVVNKHVNAMNNLLSRNASLRVSTEGVILLKNNNNILPLSRGTFNPKSMTVLGLAAGPDPKGPNCDSDLACSNGALGQGWGSGAVQFPYLTTPHEAISKRASALNIKYSHDFTSFDFTNFKEKASASDVNVIFGLANGGEAYVHVDHNYGDRNNASLWHNADEVIIRAANANPNNIVVISSVGPVNMERWINHPNIKGVIFTAPGGQDAGTAISNIIFGDYSPSGKLPFTIAKNDKDYIAIDYNLPSNRIPEVDFTEGVYIDYKLFDKHNITPRYEFGHGLSYSNFSVSNFKVDISKPPSEVLPAPPSLKPVVNIPCNKPTDPNAYTFPKGFAKVNRYIYPWMNSAAEVPHFNGTCQEVRDAITEAPLAGGGLGGNPALWETAYVLSANVKNDGPYTGAYAYQLYVEYPRNSKYDIPVRQLRGFEKTHLAVGETSKITFPILRRDLSVWDTASQSWVVPRGKYKFSIARSSRDLAESIETTIV